ncbi:HD domain-containing protein [Candidatus Thorarchaeota archaeon]|nr:MAG: HD domain-containing protein [Candidatus Thorarchaeota archaeon]
MNEERKFVREDVQVQDLLRPESKSLQMYQYLSSSPKVQAYLRTANRMAVSRLGYTDHGSTHAEVATWNALKAFDILTQTFLPNVVAEGIGDMDDARLIVLAATYLHDIGMVVHRTEHAQATIQLARPILEPKLEEIYDDPAKATDILSFTLHGIYSHDDDTQCLTFEAGITKIGDGCDMTKGRTIIPYQKGKVDIHSVSALAIEDVILEKGSETPLRIAVAMDNPAGVFQVQAVLEKKLSTSGLGDHVTIDILVNGDRLILSKVKRLFKAQVPEHADTLSIAEREK